MHMACAHSAAVCLCLSLTHARPHAHRNLGSAGALVMLGAKWEQKAIRFNMGGEGDDESRS
jgi:hypothetical protein